MDFKHLLDIVIVGGSLTALAAASALRTLPLTIIKSITVLERQNEDSLRDQGAGIRVGVEVEEFMQRFAGLKVEEYSVAMKGYATLGTDGGIQRKVYAQKQYATTWKELWRAMKRSFLGGEQESSNEHGKDIGNGNGEIKNGTGACRYFNGCTVIRIMEGEEDVEVWYKVDGREERIKADLVLGCDGASSGVRKLICPEVERAYAGYVILRGLVAVEDLSEGAQQVFDGMGVFAYTPNSQAITYIVPGDGVGETLLNWGWYSNKTTGQLEDLMTDGKGMRHSYSLPMGSMKQSWDERIKADAKRELPPQFAEAIEKTHKVFVQVVTDSLAEKNVSKSGRILLLGDAAAGQRPHTASAVTQSVFASSLLRQVLLGKLSLEEWSRETQAVSEILVSTGQNIGEILMIETASTQEKQQYVPVMFKAHKQLLDKWRYYNDPPEREV